MVEKIESAGGIIKSIEEGRIQREILEEAYEKQKRVESGEQVVIGLNHFVIDEEERELNLHEYDENMAEAQIKSLDDIMHTRDNAKVKQHLDALRIAARSTDNLMPYLIEAFRDYVSLGEVCHVFKEEFGTFEQPLMI